MGGIGLQLLADRVDMDIKIMFLDELVFSPEGRDQLVPLEHLPRILSKIFEDAEAGPGQSKEAPGHSDLVPFGVDGERTDPVSPRRFLFDGNPSAAKERLDAGDQLPKAKRLGKVIVGAPFQTPDAMIFLSQCRKNEKGDRLGFWIFSKQSADLPTA